jgi:hypothetical protein
VKYYVLPEHKQAFGVKHMVKKSKPFDNKWIYLLERLNGFFIGFLIVSRKKHNENAFYGLIN